MSQIPLSVERAVESSAVPPLLHGYLVERPDGWLEVTTNPTEATHAHVVEPESGDLIVVTMAEAAVMLRPGELVMGDTLMIYGV